ncbi:M20 family metallo-hydrolase [Salicibibacter cibarius]|uniref:M20 family metallo-hydrolase n=1 Tax=Salicibibacter cibarius TaxID=2743000 RepID=A0A7T6Z1E0_9BACI|nr:M20 family metallo-hydrolase [Salicibibacter cibarius]QQK75190.1 M20 family metallo-hydrolase [Salicibibacter cibarius]
MMINLKRLMETVNTSAAIGATENGGLHRLALSREDTEMRATFVQWLETADLRVTVDDFGNIYGWREGTNPGLSPVVIGSHLDTQPYGGKYDGVIGVLTALEVIRTLNDKGIKTERPIVIVNFTNEEGARFMPPLLGSGALIGDFSKTSVYETIDAEGISFETALYESGYPGEKAHRLKDAHAFMELHIEQGPVLEQNQKSIGIVQGIQGLAWLTVHVKGKADHAGTTPMSDRKDALVAASAMVTALSRYAASVEELVITVGTLQVEPSAPNVVPSGVTFTIDMRHPDDHMRKGVPMAIRKIISDTSKMYDVDFELETNARADTVHFPGRIQNILLEETSSLGYEAKQLYSGASHDAKNMIRIAETSMIFVPSANGKSHHEEEYTSDADIEKGANVLLWATKRLADEK